MGILTWLYRDTCVICGNTIPEQRRSIVMDACSDACDAEEQASRPF